MWACMCVYVVCECVRWECVCVSGCECVLCVDVCVGVCLRVSVYAYACVGWGV